MLLQNPDDLPKSGCASCSGPCLGPERTSNWIRPKGQVQDASKFDYDGTPRPQGKGVDIGAFEAATTWGSQVASDDEFETEKHRCVPFSISACTTERTARTTCSPDIG
ncbi:choice-of-anchor Q domain-containing protein [Bradyrhizobium algeriense]|uniref:choice-of-anchor Q domain-containing protein n=1 Tax=Bradyrhizobium algeriense TaxID=634784 RepID=UPI003B8497E2